jgi:hypothetical protein
MQEQHAPAQVQLVAQQQGAEAAATGMAHGCGRRGVDGSVATKGIAAAVVVGQRCSGATAVPLCKQQDGKQAII